MGSHLSHCQEKPETTSEGEEVTDQVNQSRERERDHIGPDGSGETLTLAPKGISAQTWSHPWLLQHPSILVWMKAGITWKVTSRGDLLINS